MIRGELLVPGYENPTYARGHISVAAVDIDSAVFSYYLLLDRSGYTLVPLLNVEPPKHYLTCFALESLECSIARKMHRL